jgi:hypothetical protein
MNPKVIIIDGKTYNNVDEMPPDVRPKYELAMSSLGDANGNHIPDVFESKNIFGDKNQNGVPDIVENLVASQSVVSSMKIIVDGKEFNGVENLPPEARAKYEAAIAKLDANKNGIPDFLEGAHSRTKQSTTISARFEMKPQPATSSLPVSPTVTQTPDTSNGWRLMLAGLIILFLCVAGAAGAWYLFLR